MPVVLLAALGAGALLAACGGGGRLDAREPNRSFPMSVVRASFPSAQAVARPTALELEVKNTGSRTVPKVAVTVDSFDYTSTYPGNDATKRPIWAIERGPGPKAEPPVETEEVSIPGGAQTAYVNTWALGRLGPGQTQTFVWKLVPVKPGTYTVAYRLAAGLAGRARAVPSSGSLKGSFTVEVAKAPPKEHVNPATGKLAPGPYLSGTS